MDRHTFYLLSAYGVFAVAIAIELLATFRQRRSALTRAREFHQLDDE